MKVVGSEYLLLLVCAAGGFGAVTGLVAMPVGTAGLMVSSLPKYFAFWEPAKELDRLGAVKTSIAISAVNAFVAVAAAYGTGVCLRLVIASS